MTCILFKVRKTGSQQLGARKNVFQHFLNEIIWFLAFSIPTNTFATIWREKKLDPCYLETKKVVHNCQEQGKRL